MSSDSFIVNANGVHVSNMEGKKSKAKVESAKVKDNIRGHLLHIVDDSLTVLEAGRLRPLDSLTINVWPTTKEHTCEGRSESDGLVVTVKDKRTLQLKKSEEVVVPLRVSTPDSVTEVKKMSSTEVELVESCQIVTSRTLFTGSANETTLKYVCERSDNGPDDYVSIEFPGATRPSELRIYLRGAYKGQVVAIRGTVNDLLVAAKKLLPIDIDLNKFMSNPPEADHIVEVTDNLRTIIFFNPPKPEAIKKEDDIPF